MNRDPHGDQNGLHRRDEHRRWHFDYGVIRREDIKPFQIVCTRERSMISAIIVSASISDGHPAWLSHCGQIMADGVTVSEAVFPTHKYTHIDDFLHSYGTEDSRMTLVQLRDGLFPNDDIRHIAERKCQLYHESLAGTKYDFPALIPMLITSVIRNTIPFLKNGPWYSIPEEKQKKILICSAELDDGWGWLQREINHDIFPSTLSLKVPSPQDIYDSPDSHFVAGTRKIYDK